MRGPDYAAKRVVHRLGAVGHVAQTESDQQGRFILADLPRDEVGVTLQCIGLIAHAAAVRANQNTIVVCLRLTAVALEPVQTKEAPIARQRFEMVAQTSTITVNSFVIGDEHTPPRHVL